MSIHLILCGVIWVLGATVTAMLPMRRQMVPGLALLIAAPVLIGWGFQAAGPLWGGLFLLAFGSMFRRPLIYFGRKALGLPTFDPRKQP